MLAREFVDSSFRRSVGNVQSGSGECARGPDVAESSAAAIRNPKAWILSVPTTIDVGIGRMRVVVNLLPDFVIFLHRTIGIDGTVHRDRRYRVRPGSERHSPS